MTVSHTVTASGSDRVLIAFVATEDGSDADLLTGVTYNGVAMTEVEKHDFFSSGRKEHFIYYLADPDTGTHDIVASFDGTNDRGLISGASFLNASQTTPTNTAEGRGTGGVLDISITTASDNSWVVGGGQGDTSSDPATCDDTTLDTGSTSGQGAASCYEITTTAGLHTLGFNLDGNMVGVIIELEEADAGGEEPERRIWMIRGEGSMAGRLASLRKNGHIPYAKIRFPAHFFGFGQFLNVALIDPNKGIQGDANDK